MSVLSTCVVSITYFVGLQWQSESLRALGCGETTDPTRTPDKSEFSNGRKMNGCIEVTLQGCKQKTLDEVKVVVEGV